jgi:hypothetical protein
MTRRPEPYLTREPWLPFTPRERLRKAKLASCPSSKCRRAKACVDAHDDLYCQRTHLAAAKPSKTPLPARDYSLAELQAIRERNDMGLIEVMALKRDMIAKWKAGAYDKIYGKYRAHGVWKYPPNRQYTE